MPRLGATARRPTPPPTGYQLPNYGAGGGFKVPDFRLSRPSLVSRPPASTSGTGGQLEAKLTEYTRLLKNPTASNLARRNQLNREINELGGIEQFEKANMTPGVQSALDTLLQQREAFGSRRHSSVLSGIGRGLRYTENITAGFTGGVVGSLKRDIREAINDPDFRNIAEVVTPWASYHALAKGFKEVPKAVGDDLTYERLIKESTDPDSLLHRWALPIGLGASILFDPLTYLSFGATSVSRAAAANLLAEAGRKTAAESATLIKAGGILEDPVHGAFEATWRNREMVKAHVRLMNDRPYSLGDALDVLRQQGLARKAEVRETGGFTAPTGPGIAGPEWQKAGAMQKVQARLPGAGVLGGRGVRFMGTAIPGTPALGAAMGGAARRGAAKREGYMGLAGGLVPQAAVRHVDGDELRMGLLVEGANIRNALQSERATVGRDVRKMQKIPLSDVDRAEMNVVNSSVKLAPKHRADLLTRPETELNAAQQKMKYRIKAEVKNYLHQLDELGGDVDKAQRNWKHLSEAYPDPLQALAEWKFKTNASILGKQWRRRILADIRFAMPMHTHKEAGQLLEEGIEETLVTEAARHDMGWHGMSEGGRRYAVHPLVRDTLDQLDNSALIDFEMKRFIQMVSKPQDWWKIYATSPNPAFHVMNFMGAVWNNLLAGVYPGSGDYIRAAKVLYQGRKEEAGEAGERFLGRVPEQSTQGKRSLEVLSEGEKRTGLGRSSQLFADVYRHRPESKQLGKDIEEALGIKTKVTRGRVSKAARAAGFAALAAQANPLAFAMFAPEFAKAGRAVGGTVEDFVRLAPFMKYANHPDIRNILHTFGPITIDGMKHSGFSKAQQGIMYDIGAHVSRHFQFDYTDLTTTERYLAKTLFPFWTFYRKNFVLQGRELIKQPRTYEAALRLMNFSEENAQEIGPYEAILPQFFEQIQAFQVPVPDWAREKMGLPKDQSLYLNPKLPFVSLNLIPSLWDIINDPATPQPSGTLKALMQPVVGSVGPFSLWGAKTILEAGVGHNFGLNKPIDYQRAESVDRRKSFVPAPAVVKLLPKAMRNWMGVITNKQGEVEMPATNAYLVETMSAPFINNLGQTVPVGTSEVSAGKARANMIAWGTGIRLIPFDALRVGRNEGYNMKNMLESKQSELRQQGKELPAEDRRILMKVRRSLKILEREWDNREYGAAQR